MQQHSKAGYLINWIYKKNANSFQKAMFAVSFLRPPLFWSFIEPCGDGGHYIFIVDEFYMTNCTGDINTGFFLCILYLFIGNSHGFFRIKHNDRADIIHTEKSFEILLNQPEIRLYLPFSSINLDLNGLPFGSKSVRGW